MGLVVPLLSNMDLSDDTGFCNKVSSVHSVQLALETYSGSFISSIILWISHRVAAG